MTTSAFSHNSPFPSSRQDATGFGTRCAVRISDPGTLISSVPALLGFHPRRSLVAICLTGTSVGAVMRHDLVLDEPGRAGGVMDLVLEQFAAVAEREGADRMLAVVVDDRIPHCARPADLAGHVAVVERFRDLLDRSAIELSAAHVCSRIQAGAPWQDLDGANHGILPDPTASAVAAAQVLEGRAIRGSREELEAVLDPASPDVQERIADLIDAARDDDTRGVARTRAAADPERADREGLEYVLTRIAQHDSGDEISAEECVELALALENLTIRDSLLALSAGVHAGAAEQMWVHLARSLPDPERAEPLALLGYSAYLRGDGPMAGVALCAALTADPCHRLAGLLDDALQAGVRPAALRDLAAVGHRIANDLGVQLPPLGPLPLGGV
ncbi:DUF4192 domain-containing protein [Prescottella agglutinans]|uniref:DUF4192 domain-containing protein n=1 Tax=Prescottella agglutinans TaxID=1644129 RepID=UPI003D9958AE